MRSALLFSASLLLAATVTTPAANAHMIVIGGGLAMDCFKAAEYGLGRDTAMCDRALDEPMISRDRAATYVNRSVLRLRGNDANGALADCESSIRINSQLGEAFVNRGAALMTLGRHTEAIESLSHGIALGVRKMHFAYYDRAMAREDVGDVKGAYEDYKRALQAEPTFTLAEQQLRRFKVVPAGSARSS